MTTIRAATQTHDDNSLGTRTDGDDNDDNSVPGWPVPLQEQIMMTISTATTVMRHNSGDGDEE